MHLVDDAVVCVRACVRVVCVMERMSREGWGNSTNNNICARDGRRAPTNTSQPEHDKGEHAQRRRRRHETWQLVRRECVRKRDSEMAPVSPSVRLWRVAWQVFDHGLRPEGRRTAGGSARGGL